MATTTRILDANVNGTVYTSNANSALEALDTCHSGATAPTDEVANGKLWLDTSTTPGILKIYNNATWEVVQHGADVTVTGAFTSLGIDDNAAATAMTLDASGNVGIGTAAPNELLEIEGGNMRFTNTVSNDSRIYFTHTPTANRRAYMGALETDGNGNSLIFAPNANGFDASEAMRIDSSGHAIIPAGVTLGTSAGVYNAANTLDDYEEGTWTPTFISTGSGPSSITGATVDEAVYTKIGNFVIVRAKVFLDRATDGNFAVGNYFNMGGLPFTANTLGSAGLYGTIGQCHVYESLGSNSNAWGFVALDSSGTTYNMFLQTLNGNPDTGDPIFLDMSYTT